MRKFLIIPSLLIMGAFPALAQDCPELIEADCGGGTAWFGLRHDGANVAQGHSVTLPCDATVISMEFIFVVSGNPNGGVPSMVAGDEINLALVDAEGNQLTTATTALPANQYNDWLTFTFAEGFVVPAGQYELRAYTTVERQCSMAFCVGDEADVYDGGDRVASVNGLEGPWFEFSGTDAPFRLHLDPGTVANDARAWGSVKGLYR